MVQELQIGRRQIAFGPTTNSPSWAWVGVRAAKAVEDRFDVTLFESFATVPDATIVVIVKVQPPQEFVEALRSQGSRIVYIPIDRYQSPEAIAADAWFLGACDLVLLHSELLRPYIAQHTREIDLVEHESIYAVEPLVP